jgi:hypothetical protein
MKDEMAKTCRMHGKMTNAYKILVQKPEGKKSLGRLRCRWKVIKGILE